MNELAWVEHQLKEAYDGDPWHGPSLMATLKNVTSDQAALQPVALGHSIWELVLHITAWENVVRRRLGSEVIPGLSPDEDFPYVADTSETAWRHALDQLHQRNSQLRIAIRVFPEARLQEIVPGRKHTFRTMLHGAVQHEAYHTGQISMLKRAVSRG